MRKEISKGTVFSCQCAVNHRCGNEAINGSKTAVKQFTVTTRVQIFSFVYLVMWESTALWNKDKATFFRDTKLKLGDWS